jgi:uroporphyrinogen-III synthase
MANGLARFPLPNPPPEGEGANESLRELHGNKPLAKLNIVVTRPREQATGLALHIAALGGNAILFPLLEIGPVPDSAPLHNLVKRLPDFDLAIFISPNAVRYGLAAIQSVGTLPAGLKVATVGQGSAQALRDFGLKEIIAPPDGGDSEALLALEPLKNVAGWKIVIFRGDGGRELLGDTLKARGADVEYITCYLRGKPSQDIAALLSHRLDAITLSSSEALVNLWEMFDDTGRDRILSVPLFVPHPRIAAKAHLQGWKKVIQTTGGDDGVISGLVAWVEALD